MTLEAELGSALRTTREHADRAIGYRGFEETETRLPYRRPILFGDRLTAADISFACLGDAAILPTPAEGCGAYLPPPDGPCEALNRLAHDLRESEVGHWVLNLCRTERGERKVPAKPLLQGY